MRHAKLGLFVIISMSLTIVFMSPVFAEEGDWIDQYTTFWDGKGKISGQLRLRGESFNDFDFNDDVETDNRDDDFLLTRARFSLDLEPTEFLRAFLQVQDSHQIETDTPSAFRKGPAAREDRLDIHQAFADIRPLSDFPVTLRVGRQELSYGKQRLIGAFGWSNVGRTFQGVKAMVNTESYFVDAFFVNVVVPEDRHFNIADTKDDFYGIYTGCKNFFNGTIETYLLYRDNERLDREIYTIGTRIDGKLLDSEALDYSAEFAFQTGDFAKSVDQQAFAAHAAAGYTFKDHRATPRIGVEYNFSTGDDDPDDDDNKVFDNLYPTNHIHYGHMDLFSWRNIHNLRLSASAKPSEKLTTSCDLHFFWLDEATDWFPAGGSATVRSDTAGGADSFVGEELDLTVSYAHCDRIKLMAGYSHFFAEDFVEDTGPSDDADWVFLQTVLSF